MGLILPQKVDVLLNGSVISYYENIGYKIPRIKKKYKWVVPQNTKIKVDVNDLKKSSNIFVEAICDCCGKHKNIMYYKYNKNIERNNGIYLCNSDIKHRDFINNLTIEKIIDSIKNFYNRNNRFPKYNEYTVDNGFCFTYSTMMNRLKANQICLNDELLKIDCLSVSKPNINCYNTYIQKLKNIINQNPQFGRGLYTLSRSCIYKDAGLPDIRWFINHCPDKSVNNIDTFKTWAGLYTRHMSKEECKQIILDMAEKYNRPLIYDDFRGHKYGQVTIQMIRYNWGSLNKMKHELGLEINKDSMLDKQLSKNDFDNVILDISNYVHSVC